MGNGSVRRTSVMLEVSEEVYSGLVEPLKKEKSFAKLVASLLSAYLSDSYIRTVVDNTFDEVRKAVVSGFEDSVCAMESALINMGLLTDQLQAQSEAGQRKFSQKAEEQSKCVHPVAPDVPKNNEQEVQELRNRVAGLEKSVREGFDMIASMLKGSQGVSTVPSTTVFHDEIPASEPNYKTSTPTKPAEVVDVFKDASEEETVDSVGAEASDFLSSLVADFVSF